MVEIISKNKKMNILYITNKPIYPIIDGGCFAMESFLNALLSCEYSIKYLTLSTQKHTFNINHFPEKIKRKTSPESININTKFSLFKAFNTLITNTSYNTVRFYSKEFRDKILLNINNNTSIIILESVYLLEYLDEIKKHFKGKIYIRTHNVEHLIWEDYAITSKSIIKRIIYKHLKNKLKKFEINHLNSLDGIISISKTDTLIFKQLGIKTPVHTLSVGIENRMNETENITFNSNHFFFIGAYNWKPNRDAAEQLIHQIFPQIQNVIPNAELHIGGSFMPDYFKNYSSSSIHLHGEIKDVHAFLLQSGTLIAPITSGSGIRIKILECLALGVPVIGTEIALKGLEMSPAYCVNSISDYITYSLEINSNRHLIYDYKNDAYKFIQQHHSKEFITNKLKKIISGE